MQKRLGIIADAYAQPLFAALKNNGTFSLVCDSSAQLAIKLRAKNIDGAFLSPIDYAKDYSLYKILPEAAAVSGENSNSIFLFFNENIQEINSIAFDPSSASEIVLAGIIFSEKYDTKPKLIPVSMDSLTALKHYDSFLAVGDIALSLKDKTNKIDLVDEWLDISGLPFVHGFWVGREDQLTHEEIKIIIEAERNKAAAKGNIQQFQYELTEEAIESIKEFFGMAYYHGILKDIPDVKFFT
ncbi:MAG: hypothetical protein HZB59_05105 [Ignavibacteriales bacterium]|nr:hypothetical protein [Ignavibacteriales bacterium]